MVYVKGREQVAAGEEINNEHSRVFGSNEETLAQNEIFGETLTAKAQEEGKIRKKLKHNVGKRTKSGVRDFLH